MLKSKLIELLSATEEDMPVVFLKETDTALPVEIESYTGGAQEEYLSLSDVLEHGRVIVLGR